MTEEVQALAEVDSAPAPEVTATTDSAIDVPEVSTEQTEQPAEKTYTQAEIDAMIGKRLAREQRKWERDQAAKSAEMHTLNSSPVDIDESDPNAVVLQKAAEIVAQRDAAKQQAQIMEAYAESEEKVRDKYDDFDQVARNPNVPITEVMAEAIYASEVGPEVAYYLGSNVKEASRISRLSPFLQAKEIGKIEAKLAADPPVKKTSNAPAPITPVTARSSGASSYDTTDPRSTKTMTDSQWIEAERVRQMKKWEAQRIR